MHFYLLAIVSIGVLINACSACLTRSGSTGQCINIRRCRPIMKLLKSRPPLRVYNQLRSVHCGFEGDDPKICCEEQSIPEVPEATKPTEWPNGLSLATLTSTSTSTPTPTSVDHHSKLSLLEHKLCGPIGVVPKIYGGTSTRMFEFPWMALLAYEEDQNNLESDFRCGGTIVNKNYILTAAHCIANLPKSLKLIGVRVGEHNLAKERDCELYDDGAAYICAEKYQDFEIDSAHPHPEYSPTTLKNDIALIRISGRINFKPASVRPICLPLDKSSRSMGRTGVITGWGSTEDGYAINDVLLKVRLPILSNEICERAYRDQPFVRIWYKQVCAGGVRAKDSCAGDSGGPLQSVSKYRGEPRVVQHGVVSFGRRNCGVQGSPGVYTRVAHYVDWILNTIEK